ncbi:SH3 domain-containing protein [Psychrobacter sp. I-STPA6b]|uniref:SH3 domain-containing protein n=1 Tax=Psychrobacter sp. I-STPA6b TaxID=2585718 RepID=UPI001D0CD7B5|nr:SH3 domain-containing protein [Psychrobacter sp. I-STPA6b]
MLKNNMQQGKKQGTKITSVYSYGRSNTLFSRLSKIGIVVLSMGVMFGSAHALTTSDQCDYQESAGNWRVTNVRSNDVLNMRRDPGARSARIHTLPYNARNLEVICCVSQPRGADWCLAQQPSTGKSGWVSKRYITPVSSNSYTPPANQRSTTSRSNRPANYVSPYINDNYARLLIEKMYRDYGHVNVNSDRRFFRTFVHSQYLDQYLANISGAHPLYFNQDTGNVTNLEVVNDPMYPTKDGNYYVRVSFTLDPYSEPMNVVYRLRVDDSNQRLRIVDSTVSW